MKDNKEVLDVRCFCIIYISRVALVAPLSSSANCGDVSFCLADMNETFKPVQHVSWIIFKVYKRYV